MRFALLLLPLLTASAFATQDPGTEVLARFPDVKIEYYDVSGATRSEILASMARNRPPRLKAEKMDGYTAWEVHWNYRVRSDGRCLPETIKVTQTVTVTLPRLVTIDRVGPELKQRWETFVYRLALHEAGHVRIGHATLALLQKRLPEAPCDTINSVGDDVLKAAKELDSDYDRDTDHGGKQGVVF